MRSVAGKQIAWLLTCRRACNSSSSVAEQAQWVQALVIIISLCRRIMSLCIKAKQNSNDVIMTSSLNRFLWNFDTSNRTKFHQNLTHSNRDISRKSGRHRHERINTHTHSYTHTQIDKVWMSHSFPDYDDNAHMMIMLMMMMMIMLMVIMLCEKQTHRPSSFLHTFNVYRKFLNRNSWLPTDWCQHKWVNVCQHCHRCLPSW